MAIRTWNIPYGHSGSGVDGVELTYEYRRGRGRWWLSVRVSFIGGGSATFSDYGTMRQIVDLAQSGSGVNSFLNAGRRRTGIRRSRRGGGRQGGGRRRRR